MDINQIMASLEAKHPGESEYLQAVKEVLLSIQDIYNQHPEFEKASLIERLVEPDRIFTFKVPWVDDKGKVQVNLGYRVQFNNAIGPYKGGIRFHASVNLSILKFLGFEQTFKNALTTLPMGGGKGGSDFSPRGKSDAEIMRFCQAFMLELWRHVGPDMDVPAGDIGVGGREVGYMFGMYKKLTREFTGTFTGKGLEFGGSLIRPEATGFGGLYFVNQMLKNKGIDIKGKTVAVSGFGNVAWGAVTKATELGAKVVTISGPDGYVYDPDGISGDKIDYMLELRASGNDIVAPYAEKYPNAKFVAGRRPWEVKVDIALPCATQNEIDLDDAKIIIENDDKTYTAQETLNLCNELHLPMVLDIHHHNCNNSDDDIYKLIPKIFQTWKNEKLPPKLHFSSPKTGEKDRKHADFINPNDFVNFLENIKTFNTDIDIMLECKEKDLALFKLVSDIQEIKPEYKWIDESTFIV